MEKGISLIIDLTDSSKLDELISNCIDKYTDLPVELLIIDKTGNKDVCRQIISKYATTAFIRHIRCHVISTPSSEYAQKASFKTIVYINNLEDSIKTCKVHEIDLKKSNKVGQYPMGKEYGGDTRISTIKSGEKSKTISTKNKFKPELLNNETLQLLDSAKTANVRALKSEYKKKGLDRISDNFALYRIIGNDLYPRHKKGQSLENLRFILKNEPKLKNCEKIYVVNRIINNEDEKAIIKLLEVHKQHYLRIPFQPSEYKTIGFDTGCLPDPGYLFSREFERLIPEKQARLIGAVYRLKNNYVMNNNGARNFALNHGKEIAKWVLPWDGNCFITSSAWESVRSSVCNSPYLKYFAVPMARVTNNNQLLIDDFIPDPVEEPQLIFRSDSKESFNENYCYGRRPKVELFWRLGIPGKWDKWKNDPWDQKPGPLSEEAYQFGVAGWVARLFSGMELLEKDNRESFLKRGVARLDSIITTLRKTDVLISNMTCNSLTSFRSDILEKELECYHSNKDFVLSKLIKSLISNADDALTRGTYSVTDKTTLPPSNNPNDYWHPAPYFWPNPDEAGGLPYVRRDGERVPGTRLYEPDSDRYDRTRLQRVFDDSTILALAWNFTEKKVYSKHAIRILDRFFVNETTRMNPHLKYSQVRMGHNDNMGTNHGIIEMKDMYYYLDAVRLLRQSIDNKVLNLFTGWLSNYMEWLIESSQGKKECKAKNNHGTYYDLQVAAIASFMGETNVLYDTLIRSQTRISQQFLPDGSQPEELNRTNTAHYCCFNFQGWLNLAALASKWGVDLWSYKAKNGASLISGAKWLLSHMGKQWPYRQMEEFDYERFYPIWFGVNTSVSFDFVITKADQLLDSYYKIKPLFYPHDGIKPYWNLGSIEGIEKSANISSTQLLYPKIQKVECDDNKRQAEIDIDKYKRRLFSIGFVDKTINDLRRLIDQKNSSVYKTLAAWELARWYANQRNKKDAERSLIYISLAIDNEKNIKYLNRAAILKSECFDIIGDVNKAKVSINKALISGSTADLYLAASNLETSTTEKLMYINRALQLQGISEITLDISNNHSLYDSLRGMNKSTRISRKGIDLPKVSIIIPAYNAENHIRTTLDSLLIQSWTNLEIIVVDDCSTDNTVTVVENYVKNHPIIKLLKTKSNSGPYVARNLALDHATGEYVTCNDADDWSHPQKIEKQVLHLFENPSAVANTSEQARATTDLKFFRRGNYGRLVFENMSSLMFRREPIKEHLGYWDSVRFGADNEFIRRIRRVFGKQALVNIPTGPLSFQRQSSNSLTGNEVFGYHGYYMGARLEYYESLTQYHDTSKSFYYEFPQKNRPFPVPEPMLPEREVNADNRRHFDLIIASDFRLSGDTLYSNIDDLRKERKTSFRTGLIQMSTYNVDPRIKIKPEIRKFIDGNHTQLIVYGEKISCDLMIIRNPAVLQEWQRFVPDVIAKKICIIINQLPKNKYSCNSKINYDITKCYQNLKKYFRKSGIWCPINSKIKKALYEYHNKEITSITISDELL